MCPLPPWAGNSFGIPCGRWTAGRYRNAGCWAVSCPATASWIPRGVRRAWYLSRKDFTRDARLFANIIRQKLVMRDFRYGIVFSGGGGKGAYQIGVWKYLHELGIDQKIHGVSGASVGALNSLLFLQGDYQKAEELWADIRQDDFTYRTEEQEKQQAKFSQLLCSELRDLLTSGSSFSLPPLPQ